MTQRTDLPDLRRPVAEAAEPGSREPLDLLIDALNRAVARRPATGTEETEHKA
jgi:hypothetical protein